ncbi:MAG: histidine phosphatase family protein [Pseudomonadales bacterium]|nr:histidine phosphatase family protein [Pseudomonadales bacterium]
MDPPAPSLADVLDRAALVLCRHGAFARRRAENGRVSEGLTETGRREAEALAAVLAGAPRPLVLYASPQPRAVATAEVLARHLELPVHTDEDLAELRLGLGAAVPRERSAVLWELARAAPDVPPLAGAESLAALQLRALATLRGARLAHPGRIVVAVTHGGLLEAVHAGIAGRPLASLGGARLEIASGACSAWAEVDGALEELARNVPPSPAGRQGRGL